jgi:hypothetical protein
MVRIHPEEIASLPRVLAALEADVEEVLRRQAAMERIWPALHWGATGGRAGQAVVEHLAARTLALRSHIRRTYAH